MRPNTPPPEPGEPSGDPASHTDDGVVVGTVEFCELTSVVGVIDVPGRPGPTVVGGTVTTPVVVVGALVPGTVVGATVVGASVVGLTVVGVVGRVVGGAVVGGVVGDVVVGGLVVGGVVVGWQPSGRVAVADAEAGPPLCRPSAVHQSVVPVE